MPQVISRLIDPNGMLLAAVILALATIVGVVMLAALGHDSIIPVVPSITAPLIGLCITAIVAKSHIEAAAAATAAKEAAKKTDAAVEIAINGKSETLHAVQVQLDHQTAELKEDLNPVLGEVKKKVERLEAVSNAELVKYTHDRTHAVVNALQALTSKLDVLIQVSPEARKGQSPPGG